MYRVAATGPVVHLVSSSCQFGAEGSAAGAEMSAAFQQPDTLDLSSVGFGEGHFGDAVAPEDSNA
jgi:hypothetical protein